MRVCLHSHPPLDHAPIRRQCSAAQNSAHESGVRLLVGVRAPLQCPPAPLPSPPPPHTIPILCACHTQCGGLCAVRSACTRGSDQPAGARRNICKHARRCWSIALFAPCHQNANTQTNHAPNRARGARERRSAAPGCAGHSARRCTVCQAAETGRVPATCAGQPSLPNYKLPRFNINPAGAETAGFHVQFGNQDLSIWS